MSWVHSWDRLVSSFCLWHLYVILSLTYCTYFTAHWTPSPSPPRWPGDIILDLLLKWQRWFLVLPQTFFAFTSGILCLSFQSLFYLAKWLLRSEERTSGGCQVWVQPLCHSAVAGLGPVHILMWQPQRNPKQLSLYFFLFIYACEPHWFLCLKLSGGAAALYNFTHT